MTKKHDSSNHDSSEHSNIECHKGPEHKHHKHCTRHIKSYVTCNRKVSYDVSWKYHENDKHEDADGKECGGKKCEKD
jgi:hypothetical protein